MSQTATTKHGEKDDKNDEAMVNKSINLDHLNQQIHKSKDALRKIHRKISSVYNR